MRGQHHPKKGSGLKMKIDSGSKGPDLSAFKWFGIAWVAVGAIVGGGFVGWLLDTWLNTSPLFTITCMLGGVAGGFWQVYRMVMKDIGKK